MTQENDPMKRQCPINNHGGIMKTMAMLLIFLPASAQLLAQPDSGKTIELSLSGSFQSYSMSGSSSSSTAILLSPRIGFLVVQGLEIEPELSILLPSAGDAAYVLNGNICYNFDLTGKARPFVLAGYGISNAVPVFNIPMFQTSKSTLGVLNIGLGMKVFITPDVALRCEYRFQEFTGEESFGYGDIYNFTSKIDTRIHTVEFGFTILL